MDWILDHIDAVLAVVAFIVAGWKARKAGTLATFLVNRVENIATPEDKAAIKAQAIAAGVQGTLGKTVVNAGLSSSAKSPGFLGKALQAVLPLLLVAVALGGCVSTAPYKDALGRFGEAGRAIQPHLRPAENGGVQALYDSFDLAVKEALATGGK